MQILAGINERYILKL